MEDDNKHTPGPWVAMWICNSEWGVRGPKPPSYGNDGFLEADAKLMAAAPEMLEALIKLTALIRDMNNVYSSKAIEWLMEKETFKNAEDVIRKAEGRDDEHLLFGIDRDKPIDDEKMARLTEETIKKMLLDEGRDA